MIMDLKIGDKVTIISYDSAVEKFSGTNLNKDIKKLNNKTNLFQKGKIFIIADIINIEDCVILHEIGGDYPVYIEYIDSVIRDKKESILEEAENIRGSVRQADYGDAVENFKWIAKVASEIRGKKFVAEDIAIIQIALKLCRERFKHKRDNLVDLCGYADIWNLIKEEEQNGTE